MQKRLNPKKQLTLDDLSQIKKDLKKEIDEQGIKVKASAKRLIPFTKDSTTLKLNSTRFLPLSILTVPFRKGNFLSIIEGALTGYKIARKLTRVIRR